MTSLTVMPMAASVAPTPSLARTENAYTPGPCASVGVHENTPVDGLMPAPEGALTSENVTVCAGTSLSVAEAVNE